MATVTRWNRIDLALPELPYKISQLVGQGKGSTVWATHSHTPVEVSRWGTFDACIRAESQRAENSVDCNKDLAEMVQSTRLRRVTEEEHVTINTESIIAILEKVIAVEFSTSDKFTPSNPDIIVSKEDTDTAKTTGTAADYVSPIKDREKLRKSMVQKEVNNVLFAIETKPFWKFCFLMNDTAASTDSTDVLVDQWEVPAGYSAEDLRNKRSLPGEWPPEKKKIFHLIRQVYGQMASSKRKYGILHIYEVWWFCRRTPKGALQLSRPFQREATSPSVLQAIATLVGMEDHCMGDGAIHPSSARKAKLDTNPAAATKQKNKVSSTRSSQGPAKKPTHGRACRGGQSSSKKVFDFAESVYLWDCELVDVTDHVKLFTTKLNSSILIKLQRNPRAHHVAAEMRREAEIYEILLASEELQCAIPAYYGYSDHLGVAMVCLGMEGPDLDDLGIENLSEELKLSALESLRQLNQVGLLHNDLELRNIVQSRQDPNRAKIIDFGRAAFSDDTFLLQQQMKDLKFLLWPTPK